jgi:hypothetical protein
VAGVPAGDADPDRADECLKRSGHTTSGVADAYCLGFAGAPRRDRTGGIPGSLSAEDIETAARLCLAQVPPLRAGDALHLALCQRLNLQLASFDRGLCKAAAHHQVAHQQRVI